jgi:hypothetical protein
MGPTISSREISRATGAGVGAVGAAASGAGAEDGMCLTTGGALRRVDLLAALLALLASASGICGAGKVTVGFALSLVGIGVANDGATAGLGSGVGDTTSPAGAGVEAAATAPGRDVFAGRRGLRSGNESRGLEGNGDGGAGGTGAGVGCGKGTATTRFSGSATLLVLVVGDAGLLAPFEDLGMREHKRIGAEGKARGRRLAWRWRESRFARACSPVVSHPEM